MQPVGVSHQEFPHSTAKADRMRVVDAVPGLTNVYVHLNIPYAVKDQRALHLQIIQASRDSTFCETDDARG